MSMPNSKRLIFTFSLLFIALMQGASSQSTLNFPRMVFEPGTSYTGFSVSNPTDETAQVLLTAYDAEGRIIRGHAVRNPVTISLPPRNQAARLDSEYFNFTQPVSGWVQATSSVSGLTGFFLLGNVRGDSLDGAEAAKTFTEFAFPFVAQADRSRTEIDLVNPNNEEATITLKLLNASGAAVTNSRHLTLPPKGSIRMPVSRVFSGAYGLATATHIRGSSDRPVIGFELVRNFTSPMQSISVRNDVVGLSAIATNSNATPVYFPHLVSGDEFFTLIGLINLGSSAQDITLTAFRPDGTIYDGKEITNPRTVRLSPRGALRMTARELFGFPRDGMLTGWIKAEPESAPVAGFAGCGSLSKGSFAAMASQAQPMEKSAYSQVIQGLGFYTGIALLNPNKVPTRVEVFLLRNDGSTVGIFRKDLQPHERVARLLHELISDTKEQIGGFIYARSDQPIFTAELLGSVDDRMLVTFQAQPVTQAFTPSRGPDLWINTDLGEDVLWRQKEFSNLSGGRQFINVVVVPTSAHVAPRLTRSRTTSQTAEAEGGKAAVNGGYYGPGWVPLSLIKIDNVQLANNARTRAVFGILRKDYGPRVIRTIKGRAQFNEAYHALGGGPRLLRDGKIDIPSAAEGFSEAGFVNVRRPRTGLGIAEDGTLYMVTVDGRQPGRAIGMTLLQFADLFRSLGAHQAMNLDGGGSTTMWIRGYGVVNRPSDIIGERRVSDCLIVW